MVRFIYHLSGGLCVAALLSTLGCGKAPLPGAGGPPEDYAVRAVVAPVEPEPLAESIFLVGSLMARQSVDIVSEINAPVAEILFEEGQAVEAGEVLLRMKEDKLAARERESEAHYALAKANFDRGQELRSSETISQAEYDRLAAEFHVAEASLALVRAQRADTVIRAPFSGVLSDRKVSIGQWLAAGDPVIRLIQMDPLEAMFQVPERYIPMLAIGQLITLSSVALPGRTFEGHVFFIDPEVDVKNRTVLVKAEVSNTEGLLKPGMFVRLELILTSREDALLIPEAAIQLRGDQAIVFVMDADDRAEIRPVKVGRRVVERAEILSGLTAGDRVVVEGYQKMGPGVRIAISPDSARYGLTPTPES